MNEANSAVEIDPKAIFLQALDCESPAELARFLDESCAGHPALRARVDDLLRAHQEAGRFLGGVSLPNVTFDQPVTERPGTIIGPYKLLEQIGEGGMGVVFMAEQTHPVQRKVALKIVKPGMDTKQVIARFEAERQALALMDHPNIARVIDAGTTESGRPYFVMELVRGVPITEFCDQHKLAIRERLELFIAVCQAVQHAHQKGIIHRDLKPTNVLVTLHDTKLVVKVIDFGVAKATGQKLTEKTLFTGLTQMIGTPLYMSPEQAEMSGLDVDTRSDIYSLGVLLYELLTGTTPFDSQRMKEAPFDEMRRIIREEEPPRPSTRLSTLAQQDSSTISEKRNIDPRHLSRLFQRELDWIVMKCLEKDRNRRYETASALGADVENYLANEPVQACPPSTMYRFRKFARRNKWALIGSALLAVMTLIIVGVVAGSVGWVARDRATREAVLEHQIGQALTDTQNLCDSGKLTEAMSALKSAEGLLATGGVSEKTKHRLAQWRTDLAMVNRLEQIRFDQAAPSIISSDSSNRGVANAESGSFSETDHADKIWGREQANYAYRAAFEQYGLDLDALDVEKSSRLLRNSAISQILIAALDDWVQVIETLDRSRNKKSSEKYKLLEVARQADPDPMRAQLREAIQRDDTEALLKLADESGIIAEPLPTVILLARAIEARHANSPKTVEIVEQIQRRHPADFWITFELADLLPTSRLADEVMFRRVAVALRPDSPGAHEILGVRLLQQRNYADAEVSLREAIRLLPDYGMAYSYLGDSLEKQGKFDEAVEAHREAILLDPKNANCYRFLGDCLVRHGLFAEAEAIYREGIRIRPDYAVLYQGLGRVLLLQGKEDDARVAFGEEENLNTKLSPNIAVTRPSTRTIQSTPDNLRDGKVFGGETSAQAGIAEAEAAYRRAIQLNPYNSANQRALGDVLSHQGKFAEAEAVFREALHLNPNDTENQRALGDFLNSQGKFAEVDAVYQDAVRLEPNEPKNRRVASSLAARGKNAEAEAAFRDVIRLQPNWAHNYRDLGDAMVLQNRDGEAEVAYRNAIHLDPNDFNNQHHFGLLLADEGKYSEAAVALRDSLRLKPDDKQVQGELATVLAKQAGPKVDSVLPLWTTESSTVPDHQPKPVAPFPDP